MLQKARVTAFTVSKLLTENQQGGAVKLPPPPTPVTQVRVKRQSHKMVEDTQTIRLQTKRQQKSTNCLSVFDHFVGLTFKGVTF